MSSNAVGHFIIDQPPYDYMTGHGAGRSAAFARRYGSCIYRFMATGEVPDCAAGPSGFATLGLAVPPAAIERGSALAGLWYGTWAEAGRVAALLITRAHDDKAVGFYVLGPGSAPQREKPERSAIEAAASGNTLQWNGKSAQFYFELQHGSRLAGTWTGKTGEKLAIAMQKGACRSIGCFNPRPAAQLHRPGEVLRSDRRA